MREIIKTGGYDAVIPRFPLVRLITFEIGAFYHELVDVVCTTGKFATGKGYEKVGMVIRNNYIIVNEGLSKGEQTCGGDNTTYSSPNCGQSRISES
jgi:hypothetical protein